MRRIIALAATALLCALLASTAASARGGGGHGGMGGGHGGMGMGGMHGSFGGMRGGFSGVHGGFRGAAIGGFHRPFVGPGRFAFRHHRFHRFHNGFFFASIDDSYGCVAVSRVWTPWGWRWRRVWVCG